MLAVNATACERLGYTRNELLAMNIDAVDAADQGAQVPERMARLMAQGRVAFETVHRRKDGSLVPTEVNAQLITWEGRPAVMSIARDITERVRGWRKRSCAPVAPRASSTTSSVSRSRTSTSLP